MRRAPFFVVLSAIVVLSACGGANRAGEVVTSGEVGTAGEPGAAVEDPPPARRLDAPPYGPGVTVGQTYPYRLYTHCGIEWARVDGVWWRAAEPASDGQGNPPDGSGNPFDDGELVIVDHATAVYRGSGPGEVVFERTALVDAPFQCD